MLGKRRRSVREARIYRSRLITIRIENRSNKAYVRKVVGVIVVTVVVNAVITRALRRITGVVTTITGLLEGRVVLDDRYIKF